MPKKFGEFVPGDVVVFPFSSCADMVIQVLRHEKHVEIMFWRIWCDHRSRSDNALSHAVGSFRSATCNPDSKFVGALMLEEIKW